MELDLIITQKQIRSCSTPTDRLKLSRLKEVCVTGCFL